MLSNMTLARWIIVFSLLGSAGLAYFGWNLRQRRLVLQEALDTHEVESLAQGLLVKAMQHTQLYKEFENTGTGQQDNLNSYIVRRATKDTVGLGNVRVSSKEEPFGRNAIDKKVTITPQFDDKGVQRTQIANFLYYLETDSRRLYVTRVHIEPEQKRLKAFEIPNDRWLWEAEVTVRQKREE